MQERDFKGVWIPKEIWLNEELTMLDKVIYTEISSLDGPNHCTASNEYLANFCQCSERKISESINKLINLGMIEIVSFDGRVRVAKISKQTSKICESASQNLLSINIDNNISTKVDNIDNNKLLSAKPKKKNMFQHCIDEINERYADNTELINILVDYLKMSLERKDEKRLKSYAQWKGLLNKLDAMQSDKIAVVKQSISKYWATFVEVKTYHYNDNNVSSVPYTQEEKENIERWQVDNDVPTF